MILWLVLLGVGAFLMHSHRRIGKDLSIARQDSAYVDSVYHATPIAYRDSSQLSLQLRIRTHIGQQERRQTGTLVGALALLAFVLIITWIWFPQRTLTDPSRHQGAA